MSEDRESASPAAAAGAPAADVTLAETFAALARSLLAQGSLADTLTTICTSAVDTIDGCDDAAISLVRGRVVETRAGTSDLPRRVDELQVQSNEGPCLDAIREHEVFRTGDLSQESRWPSFSRRAADETGVRSMVGIRLFAEEDTMGALNLFSRELDAFDETSMATASVFAAHAAVAMVASRRDEQFTEALAGRDLIGQAKGILMARQDISADEAFALLRRASQRLNIKVGEVARQVAAGPASPAAAEPPVSSDQA